MGTPLHQGLPAFPATFRPLLGLLLVGGATAGLVITNPNPAEFEQFAADRLTNYISDELCAEDGLPLMIRLVIQDCRGLILSQHRVLGRMAVDHTRRRNFGILSVYTTELGGQRLFSAWELPTYRAMTLAAAGRFVLLQTGQKPPGELQR